MAQISLLVAAQVAVISVALAPERRAVLLCETGQGIRFSAAIPIERAVSARVAEEFVEAAWTHWLHYRSAVRGECAGNPVWRAADFFFATWPDLPQRIEEGTVRLEDLETPCR